MIKTKIKNDKTRKEVCSDLDTSNTHEPPLLEVEASERQKETIESPLEYDTIKDACSITLSAVDSPTDFSIEETTFYDADEQASLESHCEESFPVEPSAPIMLEECGNDLHHVDAQERNQPELVKVLEVSSELHRNAEATSEMKPYIESQLMTLYDNCLLNDKEVIISDFTETERNVLNCEFYEIMQTFLDARMSLIRVEDELRSCNEMLKKLHKCAWTFEEKAECEDDVCLDNVVVKAHFKHETAHFQTQMANKLYKYSKKCRAIIFDSQTLYVYQAEVQKVRAENFLQKVISMCSATHELAKYSPVTCSPDGSRETNENINALKECISVLFSFVRRGINDDKFNRDVKSMLSDAAALLLRFATYADNFFILNHLLRCPAGVGDWGSQFIQVPSPAVLYDQSVFGCPELDYALTILSIILSPIKQRDSFLSCYKEDRNKNDNSDCEWVVLDCNSEDDHCLNEENGKQLAESDLIQFMNQIPFEGLFKHVLGIEDGQNTLHVSSHLMMKFFALSTCLLKIFETGLLNYSKPEYDGVTKRICRLIGHTVLYVTHQWNEFQNNHLALQTNEGFEEDAMYLRLQIEYDEYFERVVRKIFNLRHISGTWESLCSMPYDTISSSKLCKIICNLFTGYTEHISSEEDYREMMNNVDVAERFFDFVTQLDDLAVFYFLTALSNMAAMRQSTDRDIIETITINIFKVSFIKNDGKESINRVGREVLSSIANTHSYVITALLESLQGNVVDVGSPALYFFKHLDLKNWIVTEDDLDILSEWILCSPNSLRNQLGRTILGKLNWGFATTGELFLPTSTHMKVILSLVEAYAKVYSAHHVGSNLITSSVKQVTSVVYSSSQGQLFLKWCWAMAGNFRLHHMDQSPAVVQDLILHPFNFLKNLSDPMSSLNLSIIKNGLLSNDAYSIFAAYLISTWGHSIPEFCLNGPKSLETLVTAGHYEAAITILFLVTPLFFKQHEELTSSVTFVKVIQSILSVDKKYSKIAIRLVADDGSEDAWELLSSLIVVQLNDYKKYNLSTPCTIVSFWVNILISLPNWSNETSVINILNVICHHSINDQHCWKSLKATFIEELKLKMPQQNRTSTLISIYNWVTFTSENTNLFTKYSNPTQPWFALLALHCEADVQNILWKQLLKSLESNPQLSLAAAVKEVCADLKVQPINPNFLSIYRFGQQILDLAVDHPAFASTLQGFLTLHLARVIPESSNGDCISVTHKFYDGYINSNFLKKIQHKVNEFVAFWMTKNSEKDTPSKSNKVIQAMGIWLHDPKFYDAGFYLPSLSPKELPKKLCLLLDGNWDIWNELLDSNYLEQSKDQLIRIWECHRLIKENTSPTGSPSLKRKISVDLFSSSIFKRLSEYDPPKPPPPLFAFVSTLQLNISLDPDNLLFDIDRVVDLYVERSSNITLMSKELCALDCVFLEILPNLWCNKTMKSVVNVTCSPSRMSKLKKCTGAANIIIEYSGKHLNEEVKGKISCNREKRTCLISQSTLAPTMAMSQAALKLEKIIQKIILWNRYEGGSCIQKSDDFAKLGRKLFYYLLGKISDETNFYPPAKQLLLDGINNLGQEFISGHSECQEELVGRVLKSEYVCNSLLSSHFTPMISSVESFLQLYEMASSHAASQPDVTFMLLSKFELEAVLRKELLDMEGREKLIKIIIGTLTSLLSNDEISTQICSELYRVHLVMILSYKFFDHYSEILTALLDMSFLIVNDSGKIVGNLWIDYTNTLAKGITIFHPDMNMPEVFNAIKLYVEGQTLLNKLMVKHILQCLTEHFNAKRVQFGYHGLYPKYKYYVRPIAILLGAVSCLHSRGLTESEYELPYVWNCVESLFSPWLCPMDRDKKDSCPKWVQQFSQDKKLLLPWTASYSEEPEYVGAIFVGVAQFIYETSSENLVLSKLLDFYCRSFANEYIKDHVLAVVHSSFAHVYWHHLSPSIKDLECIYRTMNEYLPECHSFIGNIFVQIDWSIAEQYFCQYEATKLARFNVLFLNILIRVAMEQCVRQKSGDLRQVLVTAERFHWELLDLSSFEKVINWVVISCDPRIVLNSESRNPIDIAVINILHIAAGFTPDVALKHPESHDKRCLLVRAIVRLLITCSKKHNILMLSRLTTFDQTFAILFNHLENIIIEATPKDRQFTEAMDLTTEALTAIEGGASPSTLQEVCRNSLLNWLQGQHSSDIFILPVLITISKNVLQLQHRCALLEESIKAVFKCAESKDQTDRLSWCDITDRMSFPVSNPQAMFHYAAQENDLFVIYGYCRWKLSVKRDADESFLLCCLMEIFSKLNPDENSERGFILIISQLLDLFKSQIELTGSNKMGIWRQAEVFASLLDNFGVDSSSGGILGVFGFGKESRLPIRARLVCRSLAAFLTCQLVQPGCFRSLNEPTLEDDSVPLQDNTAKALTSLNAMKKNSLYSEFKICVEWIIYFIQNYCHSILDGNLLLAGLIKLLYYNDATVKHLTFNLICMRNDPVIEKLLKITEGTND